MLGEQLQINLVKLEGILQKNAMTSNVLSAWPANQMPLPASAASAVFADSIPTVEEADLFSKGVVTKYFQNQSYGFVRDQLGRELFFHVDEMDFCGAKNNKKFIAVGARVGYDISRTSHGLRIKRIKIY